MQQVEVPIALVWRLVALTEAVEAEAAASLALRLVARDLAEDLRALQDSAGTR